MIIIFSVQYDFSTDEVIKWIKHLGGRFVRVNGLLPGEDYRFRYTLDSSGNSFVLDIDGQSINSYPSLHWRSLEKRCY